MRLFCLLLIATLVLGCSNVFGQEDSTKAVNLNLEKLRELERTIKLNDSLSELKIKRLEASITSQNFIKILKSANVEKFKNDVDALKIRYAAGEEILKHIVMQTNAFNFAYQQLVLQSQFSSLTNPTNYPEFTTPLMNTLNSLEDKKPINNVVQDLSNIKTNLPFLNNPVISSGFSIVSFFMAKYNDKKKFEAESFKKMTCVLNFTSSTDVEYKNNVQRILYLRDKIDQYNLSIKNFFTEYLRVINYKGDYFSYIKELGKNGSDFLEPVRKKFFNSILSDTTRIGLVASTTEKDDNVAYHMEQVKFYIAEYESILRDIDKSILAYDDFYMNLEKSVPNTCEGIKSVASPLLIDIKENIVKVKGAFKAIIEENQIPAKYKRTLLGL